MSLPSHPSMPAGKRFPQRHAVLLATLYRRMGQDFPESTN